jgi:hypothetical protein
MNYVLVFRPEVLPELEEVYRWYESQQPGLGDDFLEEIEQALDSPRRGYANEFVKFQRLILLSIVMFDGQWFDDFLTLFTIGLYRAE